MARACRGGGVKTMSSHREAPAISKDPAADNTDVYAFVDPTDSSKVNILANFIPFEKPEGGPNFFAFGDDVLYEIKIDNDGDAKEDITYQFRFKTTVLNPDTFLYNTLPITLAGGPNAPYSESFNIRQRYKVTRIGGDNDDDDDDDKEVVASNLETPPVNIGPRSTLSYPALAGAAIHTVGSKKFFAGQREDAFNVDLGSIFDLGTLRPFQSFHVFGSSGSSVGRDGTKGFNVHTIAMQVPKADLTKDGINPTDPLASESVVGIWASASRQKALIRRKNGKVENAGPWVQVSRLGNPLINEVVIPVDRKDRWNSREPKDDADFVAHFEHPELQILLPILYPGVFKNLAANPARPDLIAILLTGIPPGLPTLPATFTTFTGTRLADMLRLNLAIGPTVTDFSAVPPDSPARFGLLGGDVAGFPNGRRPFDNVVAIELRAIAGVTLPLVATYTPDVNAGALLDDTSNEPGVLLGSFPYLGHPHQGYEHTHD